MVIDTHDRDRSRVATGANLCRSKLQPGAAASRGRCPPATAGMGRLACVLTIFCLCAGFEWPGRLSRLIYVSAHGAAAERREAVQLLGQYPASAVRDALLLALEDDELDVRLSAADALGHVRAAEAVSALIDWLDDKNEELRGVAVQALGEIGDARALPGLTRALSDSVARVRLRAVAAIAQQPASDALPRLLTSLDDADSSVRQRAALACAEFADPAAFAALANHVSDESPDVRAAVLRAVGQLRDPRGLPLLTQALRDTDDNVRLTAIAALGDSANPAAVASLQSSVTAANDPRAARTALAALGRIDEPRAEAALLQALAQPELGHAAASALVERARRSLGEHAPPGDAAGKPAVQPVAALAKLLNDSTAAPQVTLIADTLSELAPLLSIDVAKQPLLAALAEGRGDTTSLTRALSLTAAPEVLDVLLERLARADAPTLDAVLDALAAYFAAGLRDGRACEPLLARLASAKGPVRSKLVRLIGATGAVRALPALIAALPSAAAPEELAIVEAIGRLDTAGTARAALLPLLDAGDANVRLASARALAAGADAALAKQLLAELGADAHADRGATIAALGGSLAHLLRNATLDAELRTQAVSELAALSGDADEAVGLRALEALRELHDQRAVAFIAKLLRSASARRRGAAVVALGDFPHEDTRRLLRFVMQHDGPRVAVAAALSLGEVGDQRDAAALLHSAQRGSWPLPAAAAFGLVRMAQRGVSKKHSLARLFCALAGSRDSYVRANVAVGMRTLGAEPCGSVADALTWLEPGQDSVLRVATASWFHALAAVEHGDPAYARALQSCANDREPRVAEACRATAASAPTERARLELSAFALDGQTPLRDQLVALRLSDASVFIGYTDMNGEVALPSAPRGPAVLQDPADAVP
jgi:HEAT repeat protein